MLRALRLKALMRIDDTSAHLATSGPGGLQTTIVACRVRGACLYLLLPSSSDHLFNLEHAPELLLTAKDWQLRGLGVCLPPCHLQDDPGPCDLASAAAAAGQVLVKVFPLRLHLGCVGTSGYRETLDFSCLPAASGDQA